MRDFLSTNEKADSLLEALDLDNPFSPRLEGVRVYGLPSIMFFRPNEEMIKWIVKYAKGRIIIDVGCGSGILTERLTDEGARICGVDPNLDYDIYGRMTKQRIMDNKPMLHILPKRIENCTDLYVGQKNKVLLMVARPCHSNFVYTLATLKDKETELLYITIPENIENSDLGEFQQKAVRLFPDGRSADNEVFYSLF